jgi:hypothetical protein
MSGEPFQPIGEVARWRALVPLFLDVERGQTVTFEEIGKTLDLDPDDRKPIRAAVRQAGIHLLREHDRSLTSVRDVGYRVAQADEHVDLAGRHQRKSRRALVRARAQVDHVDLSELTEEGRRIVHAAAAALAWQQQQIRKLDLRQKNLEQAVESITTRQERDKAETSAKLADLQRQIEEMRDGK